MRVALVLLAAVAGGACAPPPAARLHELPEWNGTVTLAATAGAPVEVAGEVVFHRSRQVLQLTLRGEHTVALARVASGEVRAFRDGQPAAASEADLAKLALLHAVVTAPATAPVRERDGGYELTLADGRTVTVRAEAPMPAHGHR